MKKNKRTVGKKTSQKKSSDLSSAWFTKLGWNHNLSEHGKAFTAYDRAATLGLNLSETSKSVYVVAGKPALGIAIVMVPADARIDLVAVKKKLGWTKISLWPEPEVLKHFKLNAKQPLPPIGTWLNIPTLLDKRLLKAKIIAVPAEKFTWSAIINPKNLQTAANILGNFGLKQSIPMPWLKKSNSKKKKNKKKNNKKTKANYQQKFTGSNKAKKMPKSKAKSSKKTIKVKSKNRK